MKDGIYNAKIIKARIHDNGHGFYTVTLDLDYGGIQQSFGGYGLSSVNDIKNDINGIIQNNWRFGSYIKRVMEICDVSDFSKVENRYVKVKLENTIPVSIGHILLDKWFDPKQDLFWHQK